MSISPAAKWLHRRRRANTDEIFHRCSFLSKAPRGSLFHSCLPLLCATAVSFILSLRNKFPLLADVCGEAEKLPRTRSINFSRLIKYKWQARRCGAAIKHRAEKGREIRENLINENPRSLSEVFIFRNAAFAWDVLGRDALPRFHLLGKGVGISGVIVIM